MVCVVTVSSMPFEWDEFLDKLRDKNNNDNNNTEDTCEDCSDGKYNNFSSRFSCNDLMQMHWRIDCLVLTK